MTARRPYTSEEDCYIVSHYRTHTLREIARALGRPHWSSIQQRAVLLERRGLLDRTQRCYARSWTESDEEYLSDYWGTEPPAVIARRLRRSVVACVIRAKRFLDINQRQAFWTSHNVADLFGVDQHLVVKWIDDGLLTAGRSHMRAGAGNYQMWRIEEEDIQAFIREHTERYDWRRLTNPWYRKLAQSAFEQDPWLTATQAANELGVSMGAVHRHCARGWLPATKVRCAGNHGGWRIRRSDLGKFELRGISQVVLATTIGHPSVAKILRVANGGR